MNRPAFGVQPREHSPYAFEKAARHGSRRDVAGAKRNLPALLENLQLTREDIGRLGIEPLLLDLILHHHLNIEWYERKIADEMRKQSRFFWGSVVLLALIPLVTVGLSLLNTGNSTLVAAQITAVLTGVIAFHNALRSLFEKRNLVTHFHEASSALKKELYDFEDRWAGCVPGATSPEADVELFRVGLRDSIRRAREIEAREQAAFFASRSAFPQIELRSALSEAGAAAAEIVGRHAYVRSGARPPLPSGRESVEMFGARVDALRAKLTALRANASRTQDPQQLAIIEQEIDVTRRELADAEQVLLEATMRSFDTLR